MGRHPARAAYRFRAPRRSHRVFDRQSDREFGRRVFRLLALKNRPREYSGFSWGLRRYGFVVVGYAYCATERGDASGLLVFGGPASIADGIAGGHRKEGRPARASKV